MNTNDITRGAAIVASAAALLLIQGCGSSDEKTEAKKTEGLKCLGANECKGMSQCAGGSGMSSCKGLNECMGMGWIYTPTEAACKEKGGTVQA